MKKIDWIYGLLNEFLDFNLLNYFSIKERTYSYWNYVLQNVNDFKNPIFRPQSAYASEVLIPTINPQALKYIFSNH